MPLLAFLEQRPRLVRFLWLVMAVIAVIGDYSSGPFVQFPFLFLIPISLAAWYSGWQTAVALAITLPLARLLFAELLWSVPWPLAVTLVNTAVKAFVFVVFALVVDRIARLQREVKILRGFLPICSYCKKIRSETGSWQQLEQYISDHSEAHFTHSLCPSCQSEHYGIDTGERS